MLNTKQRRCEALSSNFEQNLKIAATSEIQVIYNRYEVLLEHFRIFEKSTDSEVNEILQFVNMKRMYIRSSNNYFV